MGRKVNKLNLFVLLRERNENFLSIFEHFSSSRAIYNEAIFDADVNVRTLICGSGGGDNITGNGCPLRTKRRIFLDDERPAQIQFLKSWNLYAGRRISISTDSALPRFVVAPCKRNWSFWFLTFRFALLLEKQQQESIRDKKSCSGP